MARRRPRTVSRTTRHMAREESVVRCCLDNSVAVILAPRPHLSQAYAAVYFGVGSRHETPSTNGITHVLEHMLFRGTASFQDSTALNAAAEDFGGFLEGATYRDHMAFATACHPSATADAVAILGELVQTPRYRAMEVERGIIREELLESLDNTGRMVDLDNLAHGVIFGRHALGLPIEGTLENVAHFEQPDLEAYRRRYLVGANAVVSLAGPLDLDKTVRAVKKAFGRMPAGEASVVAAPPAPRAEPVTRFVRDASSQVDIRLSFAAVPTHHAQYPALVMLVRILSDGLASRMHAELVDRRGLAYALHAGLATYADCGLFEFEVSVAPDRAAEAVEALLSFAGGARRFRFTPQELARARRRYQYGMEFMSDSPADLAGWHGRAALFGVEDQLARLARRIATLDDSAIRQAASQVLRRQGLVVTAVGELARGEWRRVREAVARWRA